MHDTTPLKHEPRQLNKRPLKNSRGLARQMLFGMIYAAFLGFSGTSIAASSPNLDRAGSPTPTASVPQTHGVVTTAPSENDAQNDDQKNTMDGPATPPASGIAAQPAENVDLSQPIAIPPTHTTARPDQSTPTSSVITPPPNPDDSAAKRHVDSTANESLIILGTEVAPGTSTRLSWKPDQSFEGIATPTPVLVVNGAKKGPTLCLTAAIHGDELNGIEIVRRILYEAKAHKLNGRLIGVPIVNLQGFHRTSRYLPDRRDLNRYFPGNPQGSSASRIAHSFFHNVISHCDALVDLHTGSFHRTNLPQLRADLSHDDIITLSQSFGATVVLHNTGRAGTLRRAATDVGIPAVTMEVGESLHLQQSSVNHGVKSIETLLNKMAMYKRLSLWGDPEPVFYRSQWIRVDQGGILLSKVALGEYVHTGELLGTVTDPITNAQNGIFSPFKGRIIGRALDQVVMPGFAAFHIGIQARDENVLDPVLGDPDAPVDDTDEENGDGDSDDEIDDDMEAAKIMDRVRSLDARADKTVA